VNASDQGNLRIAILDSDSGFVRVLVNRAEGLGCQYRRLESPPRVEEFVAMRVNALVVDLALLGPGAWDYLERVTAAVPTMGLVVCTGRSSVGQRVRGLRAGADDWVTKPAHPEEVLARVEAVVRRRKRSAPPFQAGPLAAGDLEVRADQFQAFALGRSAELTLREFEVFPGWSGGAPLGPGDNVRHHKGVLTYTGGRKPALTVLRDEFARIPLYR